MTRGRFGEAVFYKSVFLYRSHGYVVPLLKGWYIYMEQSGHVFRMVDSHEEWDDRRPSFLHGGPGGRRLSYRFACEGSSVPSTNRYSAIPVIYRVRGF